TSGHISTRGARPRTLPSALFNAILAGMVAALLLALAPARRGDAVGAAAAATTAPKRYSYGWPVKPFDREHPVRAVIGEPRTIFMSPPTLEGVLYGRGSFSFHQGIDIAAPDGTAVYPVMSGVVTLVNRTWIRVDAGNGHAFEYWH